MAVAGIPFHNGGSQPTSILFNIYETGKYATPSSSAPGITGTPGTDAGSVMGMSYDEPSKPHGATELLLC